MSGYYVNHEICDNCGKEVKFKDNKIHDDYDMKNKWWHVCRKIAPMSESVDFCSDECLIEYLEKKKYKLLKIKRGTNE
jgi:hypothetical protein